MANQRAEGINPASDQVIQVSGDQEKRSAHDEWAPWSQVITATNKPRAPRAMEIMGGRSHQQTGLKASRCSVGRTVRESRSYQSLECCFHGNGGY